MKQLVEFLVKQPVQHQEISYVTWSSKGIRVVYSSSMVVYLTAEDMYPLAVPAKVGSLIASERTDVIPKAS